MQSFGLIGFNCWLALFMLLALFDNKQYMWVFFFAQRAYVQSRPPSLLPDDTKFFLYGVKFSFALIIISVQYHYYLSIWDNYYNYNP